MKFRTSFGEKVKNLDWLAGFFDGEGCIYYNPTLVRATIKGKQYLSPTIQVIIGQSGEDGKSLLEALQLEYGFGKITNSHGSILTKKIPHSTRMSGKKALAFLRLLSPRLLLKRSQAELVLVEQWEHFFGK